MNKILFGIVSLLTHFEDADEYTDKLPSTTNYNKQSVNALNVVELPVGAWLFHIVIVEL